MWRNLLILHLLFVLALLPVAQAVSPGGAPAEAAHDTMVMDCGQVDPAHCPDFDACAAGSHASCDGKQKSTPISPASVDRPRDQVYAQHSPERYLSHYDDLLLRPPRNA